jgi:hypothetical protein
MSPGVVARASTRVVRPSPFPSLGGGDLDVEQTLPLEFGRPGWQGALPERRSPAPAAQAPRDVEALDRAGVPLAFDCDADLAWVVFGQAIDDGLGHFALDESSGPIAIFL